MSSRRCLHGDPACVENYDQAHVYEEHLTNHERALAAVDGLATLLLADAVNVVARTVALKPSVKMTLQELWKNEEPAHKSVQAWQAAKDA